MTFLLPPGIKGLTNVTALQWSDAFLLTKAIFADMLVYFENTQWVTQEIDVEPEEIMKDFLAKVGELRSMERVGINMIEHSCICAKDLTDILLKDMFDLKI